MASRNRALTVTERWNRAVADARQGSYPCAMQAWRDTARALGRRVGRMLARIDRDVPAGLRSVLGLGLVVGGIFGFLPVLGFWMIPLGLLVIGLDIGALWRLRPGARRPPSSDESGRGTCDKSRD